MLDAIVADGAYRSQWVTGTSNGGLTARPGGDRWAWESRLFDARYDDGPGEARPVYGAYDRGQGPWGAATRFGSAHLVLRAEVVGRSTFCWPDSVFEPEAFGGPERLAELCALADAGGLDPTLLPPAASGLPLDDPLNDYVEAQVHGGVLLDRDVAALVLDPSDAVEHAAVLDRLPMPVRTHPGFAVRARDIDPDYRGRVPVDLARVIGGTVTPARLATARRSGEHDPQAVKWLWHCLARFGRQDG